METAERVRSRLLEVIFNLGKMPTANPVARGIISEKGIIYRRALALSYRIVYTIKEEQLQVLVVEIHHVKRDPNAINESFEYPNSGAIPSASTKANIRYAAMLLNVVRRVARH